MSVPTALSKQYVHTKRMLTPSARKGETELGADDEIVFADLVCMPEDFAVKVSDYFEQEVDGPGVWALLEATETLISFFSIAHRLCRYSEYLYQSNVSVRNVTCLLPRPCKLLGNTFWRTATSLTLWLASSNYGVQRLMATTN